MLETLARGGPVHINRKVNMPDLTVWGTDGKPLVFAAGITGGNHSPGNPLIRKCERSGGALAPSFELGTTLFKQSLGAVRLSLPCTQSGN